MKHIEDIVKEIGKFVLMLVGVVVLYFILINVL